ncbi:hypothetical protein BH11GEM1_BH11GEM1_02430 [soil metagenome]
MLPAYPNSGTSYIVPADVATFTYDALGNAVTAENHDARVHRQYYPNGALQRDSTVYLSADGTGFSHPTGIAVHYDLSGRRDVLTLPDARTVTSSYRSDNGALSTVTDPLATPYRFVYDAAGRVDSLVVGAYHTVCGRFVARETRRRRP